MATVTITKLATVTKSASAVASSTMRAVPQGGILEGGNPTVYDPKNPIILFVIQASLVLIFTRLLHFPLSKLRQPRVIAEVLTGIILGPSIMGRIPGFTNAIFPTASMPAFTLAANLGLVFFLFLVGLEVDLRFLVSNWRIAVSVGAAGMALPFGLGMAIAWGLFHEFHNEPGTVPISFGIYALFIAIAMAITAFPVLCRILTSLKLLHTPVGIIVLSAGVANDVVGWILLALCVALVNSGAGLTALWIFFVAIGYILLLIFAVKPAFVWILHQSGSFQNGPTQSVVALTVLMVLASAFFTGVIGIHPIFGAFVIGLICPHESGFAIKLTEKLEDLVSVLFLPLYFALSGLSTNLGLLNTGITWAYVIGVTSVAFFAKVIGGTLASRLNGLVWRESLTIGCLMSCKGLVELIVLNIGLQAKILSTRTFTIFVVMALVTTFATTPLTTWLYPKWYQEKVDLWKKGKIDWDGNAIMSDEIGDDGDSRAHEDASVPVVKKILVYLRLDGLPGLFTMIKLLGESHQSDVKDAGTADTEAPQLKDSHVMTTVRNLQRPMQVHGVRLMELTERDSSVMKVSELEEYATRDPIINAFGAFVQSKDMAVAGHIAVVPEHSFSSTLLGRAADLHTDMLLIPWSGTGSMSEYPALFDTQPTDLISNRPFASMVSELFTTANTSCHVGVFIDKSVFTTPGPSTSTTSPRDTISRTLTRSLTGLSVHSHHDVPQASLLAPSTGHYHIIVCCENTPDDVLAIRLALQLASSPSVHVELLLQVSAGVGLEGCQRAGLDAVSESKRSRTVTELVRDFPVDIVHAYERGKTMDGGPMETLIIAGRNHLDSDGVGRGGVFGTENTELLAAIKRNNIAASLLIVQAAKSGEEELQHIKSSKEGG